MYTKMSIGGGPPVSAERAAFEFLQGEILSGRLAGGDCVRQEDIAHRLSISRIPVRDAIRHLAAAGLLTIESNRRVVVTLLDAKDLAELYEMRAVLEGLAARHAVKKLTEEEFAHLDWLAQQMDQNESVGDRYIPIHNEFHEFLCVKSGMPHLAREVARLRAALQPQVRMLIEQKGVAELSGNTHLDLVKLLRLRNEDKAERALREHVRQAANDIILAVTSSLTDRRSSSKKADPSYPRKRGARPKGAASPTKKLGKRNRVSGRAHTRT